MKETSFGIVAILCRLVRVLSPYLTGCGRYGALVAAGRLVLEAVCVCVCVCVFVNALCVCVCVHACMCVCV